MNFVRPIVLLSLLLLVPALLRAQIEVVVRTLPRVGVETLGGAQGAGATQILSNDLKRTGEMTPVGGGTGDYVASGQVTEHGVSGQLLNKKTGTNVFSQNFDGSPRAAVHEFADAITLAVTGRPGFASSKIAFIGSTGNATELYLADIDGAGARAITHDGTISASPSLSRDGAKLAYTSYKSGYPDVYVIDLGTGTRTKVANYPGINSGPSFSPDGSQLALTLSKDGNPEIYTIAVGGGSPNRLTRTRGAETSPSWSPTGDQLVYSSDDHGSPQLFISSSSSITEMDHLMTGNSYCTKPDWSPDGKSIAFTTRLSGQFQIGVYDVATRTGKLITTGGGEDPAWTRDSRHLLYSDTHHLYLLDTATGQSLPIEMNVSGASEPTVSR